MMTVAIRTMMPRILLLGCCLLGLPVIQAGLLHDYQLNNTLADSLGGPSLVANGGTLSSSGYTFAPDQSLTLSNGLTNPGDYSVAMRFYFTDLSGFRKILDFSDLSSDIGLYDLQGALDFFGAVNGASTVFQPNTFATVVLTRDSSNRQTIGYVDGSQQFTFTDSSDFAVFGAANNIMNFFIDDNQTRNLEASGGKVSRIQIYDSVLTPDEVQKLQLDSGPGTATPEPATTSLIGLGLVALAVRSRRGR